MRTSDYMKVSSVHFWKTISLWCDNEFCGKGWFCLGKCVRIFLFLLQLCKGEGVHWWSCSCLYSHQILLFCCLNSPTLLKMTSFLWRIFANIKQFHHGSWKKKKKKVKQNKNIFCVGKMLSSSVQILFRSSKCNYHVHSFSHQLTCGLFHSSCSAKQPVKVTCPCPRPG